MPSRTDHAPARLAKTLDAKLVRVCGRIEGLVAELEGLVAGPRSAIAQDHTRRCTVGRAGNCEPSPMLGYRCNPPAFTGSAHEVLAHEAFLAEAERLQQKLGEALCKLTSIVLATGTTDAPRWIHPVADIWGDGATVRLWLRASAYDAAQAVRLNDLYPHHQKPLARGQLLTAARLACMPSKVGTGDTWVYGFGARGANGDMPTSSVQAADSLSALSWMAATQDHAILDLLDLAAKLHAATRG